MVRTAAAVVIALSLAAPTAYAEESVSPPSPTPVANIRASIAKVRFDQLPISPAAAPPVARQQKVSLATKISVGFIGGLAGFYAGGLLGAALEPACHCDDPGLKGFMIGAPIGAVVGAISLVQLVSR